MGTWLAVFDNNNDVCASISHRPDLCPLLDTLHDEGNRLFRSADSVVLELDLEEPVVEEVYRLKNKYGIPVFAAVSNISIALERRAYLQQTDCFICNRQEAGVLFSAEFSGSEPEDLARQLAERIAGAEIPAMVVTLGSEGAVWADLQGRHGFSAPQQVPVADTTGAGDAFFAGVAAGLTYGKSLPEACEMLVSNNGGDLDLNLFTREDGNGGFRIHYSNETKTCTVDRTGMNKRFNQNVFEVLDMPLEKELKDLRIFIDRSSIEIFANNGEALFTSHVYPEADEHGYTLNGSASITTYKLKPSVADDFVM